MTTYQQELLDDPRIQAAISEFTSLILDHFPGTTFSRYVGDDPVGVYLRAVVDIDDPDEVIDLIIDRLVTLHVEDLLPFYVLPVRTRERSERVYARDHARFLSADPAVAATG